MSLYVPALALAYLLLQVSSLVWTGEAWRRLSQLPVWLFGAATVGLVVGSALGAPMPGMLLLATLPMMTVYLSALWLAYLVIGPRPGQRDV